MTKTPDSNADVTPGSDDETAASEAERGAQSEQTGGRGQSAPGAESPTAEEKAGPPHAAIPAFGEALSVAVDAASKESVADGEAREEGARATEARADASSPTDDAAVAAIEELRSAVEKQSRFRQRDQELIDRLHSENERLRQGEVREVQRPVLTALARLHDALEQMVTPGAEGTRDLQFVRDGILDALEGAGLERIDATQGEGFERGLHRAAGRVATVNDAEDRRIARVRRAGFCWTDGTVFRPAEVDVYVLAVARKDGESKGPGGTEGHQQKDSLQEHSRASADPERE